MLTIVMPAHNEAGFLETAVRDVSDGLRVQDRPFELLVIENGSTDGTLALAERLARAIPEMWVHTLRAADYGEALRTGLLAAEGDVVVVFDVDYYDLDFLTRAVEELEHTDAAIVVGSKRAPGANDTRPWSRRLVTGVFTTILRVGFGLQVSDTHGMKVLHRKQIVSIARECCFGKELFDTELILRAERTGLHTTELPVTVLQRRPSRTPILRRVPRTVTGLVRLRIALRHVPRQ